MPEHRRWPVQQNRPRVSPGTKGGRGGSTQEHASKEGMAPAGVTVVCNSNADEGMPNRPSIFAYLVFGPGGITVEGITRPMKVLAWRGPGT
jgi:hypothetical protein